MVLAACALALLVGCAAEPRPVPTSTTSTETPQPTTKQTGVEEPRPAKPSTFQVRPVTNVEPATTGNCAERPPNPPIDRPARACDAPGPVQAVYELGPARITLEHVEGAEVVDSMGYPVVQVTLNEAGAAALADLTAELSQNTGSESMAAIMLDGRVQSAPVVQATINSGAMELSGFTSIAEAQQVADELTR